MKKRFTLKHEYKIASLNQKQPLGNKSACIWRKKKGCFYFKSLFFTAVLYIDYKCISRCVLLFLNLLCVSLFNCAVIFFSLLCCSSESLCPVGFNVSHLVLSFSIHPSFSFCLFLAFFICSLIPSRLPCFQELHGVRICYYLPSVYLPECECVFVWIRNH